MPSFTINNEILTKILEDYCFILDREFSDSVFFTPYISQEALAKDREAYPNQKLFVDDLANISMIAFIKSYTPIQMPDQKIYTRQQSCINAVERFRKKLLKNDEDKQIFQAVENISAISMLVTLNNRYATAIYQELFQDPENVTNPKESYFQTVK